MRRLLLAAGLLLAGCGPTLQQDLQRVRAGCASLTGTVAQAVQTCQERERATFAAHGEAPTRWDDSLWAFQALVARKLDAGAITAEEAVFAITDYRRQLEVEARQTRAAQDTARQAELGNYLTIWRAYFGDR